MEEVLETIREVLAHPKYEGTNLTVSLWDGRSSYCYSTVDGEYVYYYMLFLATNLTRVLPRCPHLIEGNYLLTDKTMRLNAQEIALKLPPRFQSIVMLDDGSNMSIFGIGKPIDLTYLCMSNCASVEDSESNWDMIK